MAYFNPCVPIAHNSVCQINLIKNAKNHFLLLTKLKNTESAHLFSTVSLQIKTVKVS